LVNKGGGNMDRYITKTKYFSANFNTAIFSDPVRIYFSNEHESQALELYFKLQSRKNEWERFLRKRGVNNYFYILLYNDYKQFDKNFNGSSEAFVPEDLGEDFIVGIKAPMTASTVENFFSEMDEKIGFQSTMTI
jgi:hypothetical protein